MKHININTIILGIIIIYFAACFIDLTAPIDTSRGSWWNLFYQILNGVCKLGGKI